MARPGSNNDGCDPRRQLPLRKWSHVQITLKGRYLRVFYNGKQVCANGRYGRKYPGRRVRVYTSDPWYNPADAVIRNFGLRNLGGGGGGGGYAPCTSSPRTPTTRPTTP